MKKNQLAMQIYGYSCQGKKKKILKNVNMPSAGRLCAHKEFRLYAKNKWQNVCIYAKKCEPL